MASQSQGIQQLLIAEKKAAEKVSEARKRKVRRIKQARDEAQSEVEKYRSEREKQFREFEHKIMGNKEDIQARIDKDTVVHIEQMAHDVEANKEQVLLELLSLATDIIPEVHRNYFVVNPRK